MEQVFIQPRALLLIMVIMFVVVATMASRRRKMLGRNRFHVVVCGHCGTSQPSHAAFCRQCGQRL